MNDDTDAAIDEGNAAAPEPARRGVAFRGSIDEVKPVKQARGRPRGSTNKKKGKRKYTRRGTNQVRTVEMQQEEARTPFAEEPALTRRFTRANPIGLGSLPRHRMKPGRDYQFWPYTVLNERVSASDEAMWAGNGWVREHPRNWPECVPPGWSHDYVLIGNQILYSRPMALTREAREEEIAAANDQLAARMRQSQSGAGTQHHIPQQRGLSVQTLEMIRETEIGTHRR